LGGLNGIWLKMILALLYLLPRFGLRKGVKRTSFFVWTLAGVKKMVAKHPTVFYFLEWIVEGESKKGIRPK
jgi:hypothetical protein